jgi:hypothetical protein
MNAKLMLAAIVIGGFLVGVAVKGYADGKKPGSAS